MLKHPLTDLDGTIVTFLLGENGSGKSRILGQLAARLITNSSPVIAISNTVFHRFPTRLSTNYFRLAPSRGRGYALSAFKQALLSPTHERRSSGQIGKALQYAGFEPIVGVRVIPARNIDLQSALVRLSALDTIPTEDVALVGMFLKNIETTHARTPQWLDMYESLMSSSHDSLLAMIKYESQLKRANIISRIALSIQKEGKPFELGQASSGELSLLATYAFLATRITHGATILIDEPENSLHPRWQSEYCKRLLDQFYLFEPRIIIASHSPVMVSGAEADKVSPRIFTPPWETPAKQSVNSIDGILMEAFGVLVPASNYLSEKITSLLNDLTFGQLTLGAVEKELERYKTLSYDDRQRKFLDDAVALATEVDKEIRSKEKINGDRT